ncbi:MAG: type II toxin-antitoxin system RelE/ParE family toxin [Deltaproteobacteria bacterium]|nr:type II toxin-antitoxin system RelE/ParE family toxin [Deltaproteobacteria bacterium]
MKYEIHILRRAQKELERVPHDHVPRIVNAVRALSSSPRLVGCTKLTGREGWRIRVGNYRVVYEIDDQEGRVIVLHIGHRRDVYR